MRNQRRSHPEIRLAFLALLFLAASAAITWKLWKVQVLEHKKWMARIGGRSEVTVRIPSVRGEIRDRNGVVLVQNRASYEVDFYLPDMVRGYRDRTGEPVPMVNQRRNIKQMPKDVPEADIVQVVNNAIIPRLKELNLAKDYNAKSLEKHFYAATLVPFTYLEEIDFKTIAKFSEHDVGLPGVDIAIKPVREYLYGALGAHLLGYVGMPLDNNLLPDAKDFTFYQPDQEGKSQIEQSMDKYLRGKPGRRVLQRNVKGAIDMESRRDPPQPGANVYLTIDARIQFITEQALRSVARGAAVVVDPNNGEILAMATVPSYDPNGFIPSIPAAEWETLREDKADPLVNRAISAFPPGSTFKLVTALAGLRKGLAGDHENCSGGVTYGNHYFKCWISEKGGAHGTLPLTDAIKVSCNSFFYQYGNKAGIASIDRTGEMLGLGQTPDIGLTGEVPGILPGPEWMKIHSPRETWTSAQTANVSIGQGYNLLTPLQNAMVYATVANGGVSYYPRLVHKVETADGKTMLDENGAPVVSPEPKIRADLRSDFKQEHIDLVRKGLWKVVNEAGGTGGRSRIPGVQVAGKTGTAQAWRGDSKDTIAWFCCFAPFDKPKYAVCVMVQGGEHGGSVAAPIATRILEETFAMDQGNFTPLLAPMTPAHSNNPFKLIASVDFKTAGPALEGADQESADASQSPGSTQMQRLSGAPNIRVEADASGRISRANAVRPTGPSRPPNFLERMFRKREPAPQRR